MAGALQTLANLAVTQVGLRGIDWDTLNAQGRGSVWDRDYITNYMVPAQQRMQAVLATLDLNIDMDPSNFQNSYTLNEGVLSNIAQTILPLAGEVGVTAMKVEAALSGDALRYLTAHVADIANFGLLLHQDETIHHSGKSDQEIAAHADVIVGMMNAIAALSAGKLYDLMGIVKTAPAPAAGLGIAPILVVAAVVVSIALLALIAWLLINMRSASEMNATVASMCKQAQATGDTATTQLCVNTLTAASKDLGTLIPPGTFTAILKEVLPYALAGVGMYVLFLFAPAIIKSLASSRTASA
jgi:hypothetical protein